MKKEKLQKSIQGDRELLKARMEQGATQRKYKEALLEIERLQEEMAAVLKIQRSPQEFVISPRRGGASDATAFIIASDWHYEEKVLSETVNGLNEFNLRIADRRIERFWQNALKLVEIAKRDSRLKTVVLGLLGDFISGSIHEELMESNQLLPAEAIWRVQNRLLSGIKFFLANTDCEIVVVCHSGNHGRMTQKNRISTERGNSLEIYMYENLALQFQGEKRVKFIVATGYHTYISVYDYTVRFHHGHWLKYKGGVGGIYIPVNKAIAKWDEGRQADIDVFGHFHQFVDGGKFICNGSLIGFNPYALSIKASFEKPSQTFFLVDRTHGKTVVAPIWLD